MKRLSALLVTVVLCFSLFAASAKPSMDGRAVVADIGELPIGLFAKSAAFLPGDTVVVTNPATHISIEVMIFGGFDSSEGIAIILSPEAARELYITKGSNVIVQVTKKADAWSESTILSKTVESYTPDEDPDRNQEMMIDDIEEPVFDKPGVMVEDVVFYVEEPILPPEEFVEQPEPETEEEVEEFPEITAEELPAADAEADSEPVEEKEPEEVAEPEEVTEPEEVSASEETVERAPLISRGSRFTDSEVAEEAAEEELVPETEPEEEKWALIPAEAEFVGMMDDQEEGTEILAVPDAEPEEETEEEEDYIVETEVILIPTEFNPPAVEDEPVPVEPEPVVIEEEPVVIIEEEVEEDDSQLEEEPSLVVIIMDDEDSIPELPDITIVQQSELPKGYYVQILTASKMTTVEDVRDLYGRNYPLQFAESSRGGIQVLIGPLTADEYAVVQTRFRSYGYKDCFVRNIK